MAISGKLTADFESFYAAAQKAVVSLRGFEVGSAKVEASLNKIGNAFSGQKIIADAVLTTKAIGDIGGASKLTAAEQGRVNATLTEAIAKYAALGRQAPADMIALAKATQSVEAPTASLSTKMVALGAFIGTMAATAVTALARLAAQGIKAVASAIGELIMSGGRLSAIQQSFETLATSVNTTGAAMLGSMRTGTRGLVADLDLMQAANKAMLLGLPVTAAEMGTLAATATTLGRAMGQGATKSFDDLITALGRSSPMILDNLGLSVKVGEANETYAKALGKTADKLTDAEKKTAFYNAAMVAAKAKVDALGESHNTLGDAISRAGVWWDNFKTDLGIAIARSPVLNTALSEMGQAFAAAFGASNTERVQTLTTLVNGLALKMVTLADAGLAAGSILVQAYQGWMGVWQGFAGTVLDGINVILRGNALLAESMAKIPIIGQQWEGVAVAARGAVDLVDSIAQGYHRASEAAFESMGRQGAAFDDARARLDTMRVAMEAAAQTTGDHTEQVQALGVASATTAGAMDAMTDAATRQYPALDRLMALVDASKARLAQMGQQLDTMGRGAQATPAAAAAHTPGHWQSLEQPWRSLENTGSTSPLQPFASGTGARPDESFVVASGGGGFRASGGGTQVNNIYVNGTAADVARQIQEKLIELAKLKGLLGGGTA